MSRIQFASDGVVVLEDDEALHRFEHFQYLHHDRINAIDSSLMNLSDYQYKVIEPQDNYHPETNQLLRIVEEPLLDTTLCVFECTPTQHICSSSSSSSRKCNNNQSQQVNNSLFSKSITQHQRTGWGIHSLSFIPAGSFIVEYLGRILPEGEGSPDYSFSLAIKEVEQLEKNSLNHRRSEMVFDLCGKTCGNYASFFNHSCSPNMVMLYVFRGLEFDVRFPRVCFFALRDICCGEELTFDYGNDYVERVMNGVCHCMSPYCRYT